MPEENIFDVGGQRRRPANSQPDQMPAQAPQDTPNAPVQPIGLTGFGGAAANQYMQNYGSNALNNPWSFKEAFSKEGLKSGLKAGAGAAISAGAGLIGGLAGDAISGGLQSGAGSAISGIGSQVGSAVGAVNPILGAAVSVGSQLLGGVTNALFGEKVDEAKLKAANESMSSLRSFNGNVGSFDEVKGPEATASVAGTYKGGLFNSSAKRKQKALEEAMIDARQLAQRSVSNNVSNLAADQLNDSLANYSAFGGPIDSNSMGAINYGFMSDYLTNKKRKTIQDNTSNNLFAGIPGSMFALGGDMQMHGGDYTTGLMHIDEGGSHEANPNDGVQLGVDNEGTPNLVEEGETVFDDYVYSNRILADAATKQMFKLPKKRKITFAEISKKLEREASERPNDPISQAGLEAQMHQLAEQQERQKQEQEAARAKAAFEALSPEEQTAVMQQAAQQEQAMQEQAQAEAIAQQQAAIEENMGNNGGISPNPMQADGSQAMVGQEPQMMARGGNVVKKANGLIDYDNSVFDLDEIVVTGSKKKVKKPVERYAAPGTTEAIIEGLEALRKEEALQNIAEDLAEMRAMEEEKQTRPKIHYYDKGGEMRKRVYKLLGVDTDDKFKEWAKKHKLELQPYYYNDEQNYNWNALMNMQEFRDALAEDNPALKDALAKGYDFGVFEPDADGKKQYTWDKNFWENTNEASKQAGNSDNKYKVDKSYKGNVKELEDSDKYKAFTDYMLNNATDKERMDYFGWIDNNTGHKNKYIQNGKLRDDWKDLYQNARTDGLYGIQHYIPEMPEVTRGNQAQNLLWNEESQSWNPIIGDVNPAYKSAGTFSWKDKDNDNTYNYYMDPAAAAEVETPADETTPEEKPAEFVPKHRAEWPRYAGLFGPAVGLGMMAAGIGKPDKGSIDAAVSGAGDVALASYQPLGNYLTYRPMDIWYEQNRMNANARATDRAILNSGANQGAKMAGLLASGYNDQIASGDLYRKALEYNDALRERVATFNRGTDQWNSGQFGETSRFNASARNQANQHASQLRLQAAREKADMDAGWYNSLYGNVAGLFKGLGDLGRENAQWNMIADAGADGVFGNLGTSNTGRRIIKQKKKCKGGKLNKRRGLTF